MFNYYDIVVITRDLHKKKVTIEQDTMGIVTSPRRDGAWVQLDTLDQDEFIPNEYLRTVGADADREREWFGPYDTVMLATPQAEARHD
jgi:hypothetical protein